VRIRELLLEAAALGVSVHVQHFDDSDLLGYYSREEARIVLRMGMTVRETRCVLAHEISHARLGHECSEGAEERRADIMAASMLIRPEDYARAESIDPDPNALADELDVTVSVIRDYQAMCLQRLGSRTYGRSWRTGLSGALARQLSS